MTYTHDQIIAKINELKEASREAMYTKRGMNLENRANVDKFINRCQSKIDRIMLNWNVSRPENGYTQLQQQQAAAFLSELMQ